MKSQFYGSGRKIAFPLFLYYVGAKRIYLKARWRFRSWGLQQSIVKCLFV